MSVKGRYKYYSKADLLRLREIDLDPEERAEVLAELERKNGRTVQADGTKPMGFGWWDFQGWAGLFLGPFIIANSLWHAAALCWLLIALNTVVTALVIRYNKWAFLVGTVLSLNPLLWIVNGLYLRNRWNHPQVNK